MPTKRDDATWYVEALLPILYPHGRPPRPTMCRDVTVLRRLLQREPREDVLLVVREMRWQADYGQLPGFIAAGEDFTLRACIAPTPGSTNYRTYEAFKHAALKRTDRKRGAAMPQLGAILARIAREGQIG